MRNVIMAVAALLLLATSSCQKPCTRTVQKPDGTYIEEEYNCNAAGNTNDCTNCGNGGGGNGGGNSDFIVFDPKAYQPVNNEIQVIGRVVNNPFENMSSVQNGSLSDFYRRKANPDEYLVTPDVDRNMYVDPQLANTGVDKTKMTIWTYSDMYNYTETVIDIELVKDLTVGSAVTITYSFRSDLPYALGIEPSSNYQGYTMSNDLFKNATPYYAKAK